MKLAIVGVLGSVLIRAVGVENRNLYLLYIPGNRFLPRLFTRNSGKKD